MKEGLRVRVRVREGEGVGRLIEKLELRGGEFRKRVEGEAEGLRE